MTMKKTETDSKKIDKNDGMCFACMKNSKLTIEHIIPQAIGGRLKAKIYCKKCNSEFGSQLDNEVSKTFNQFAVILNIKIEGRHKDRRFTQPLEVKDLETKTKLVYDGQNLIRKDPIVEIEKESDGKTLKSANVYARSEKELKKIIGSIKKKYKMSGKSKSFQEHHPGPRDTKSSIMFDTKLLRMAVTKIVYSFICHKLPRSIVFSDSFDEVRSYIATGNGSDLACANFAHTQFMSDYIRPLHKICVSLNKQDNLVIGYIMLFGIYRYTVLLSRNYKSSIEWPGLDYTFDPVTSKEVPVRSNFRAPSLNLSEILCPKQSLQLIHDETSRGCKIMENYNDNYKFLKTDFEQL